MSTSIAARQSAARRCAASRAWVLGAALLLAAGCGSSGTSSPSSPAATSEQSTSQPSPPRSFQIATPDGQVSVSLDGNLPPNWPPTFPMPPDAMVAGSGSLGGSTSTGQVAVFSTQMSGADTLSYYTSNSRLTTTDTKSVGAGTTYVGSTKITAPYTGSVTVAGRSGTTYIVVVLKLPGASPSG